MITPGLTTADHRYADDNLGDEAMFTVTTPMGTIIGAAASDEVRRYLATTERGKIFWSRDTMRWFGTRNVRWYSGIIAVGTDANAPEGYPRHWARVFGEDGDAHLLAKAHDRAKLTAWARKVGPTIVAHDDPPAGFWEGLDSDNILDPLCEDDSDDPCEGDIVRTYRDEARTWTRGYFCRRHVPTA